MRNFRASPYHGSEAYDVMGAVDDHNHILASETDLSKIVSHDR